MHSRMRGKHGRAGRRKRRRRARRYRYIIATVQRLVARYRAGELSEDEFLAAFCRDIRRD